MRLVYFIAGLILLPLGIFGLFVPIIPGILLLVAGWACFAQALRKHQPVDQPVYINNYGGRYPGSSRYYLDY